MDRFRAWRGRTRSWNEPDAATGSGDRKPPMVVSMMQEDVARAGFPQEIRHPEPNEHDD